MRIASVAKAFSGAVALQLGPRRTARSRRHDRPAPADAAGGVGRGGQCRQLLNHTSGVPDYTRSPTGFVEAVQDRPAGLRLAGRDHHRLGARATSSSSRPGAEYEYSNTDNIVVGLMAEDGHRQARTRRLLREHRLRAAAACAHTSLPARLPRCREPFIHGYVVEAARGARGRQRRLLSPSGAWASGAIVSTPAGPQHASSAATSAQRLFPAPLQRRQLRLRDRRRVRARRARARTRPAWPSSATGPGAAPCYGHTGNFPGYVQCAAATRRRPAGGHHVAQHPGADGQAARPAARHADDRVSARCCARLIAPRLEHPQAGPQIVPR